MSEKITVESLNDLNIKELALNSDFGKLKFEKSYSYFQDIQDMFKNLDDFDYENHLTQQEINTINAKKDQFVKYLIRLQDFEIGQANSQQLHDDLENEVINFSENTERDFRIIKLTLKDIAASKSEDKKELLKSQKMAAQAEKVYRELSEKMKKELSELTKQKNELIKEKKEIETAHGEVASKYLAHHFAKQANDYTEQAEGKEIDFSKIKGFWKKLTTRIMRPGGWLRVRSVFYYLLMIVIILNFIVYFVVFFLNKTNKIALGTEDIFTPEYGLIKLALIALLYYGMHFASRNYNINSNLAAINKHRKNVAQTLDDFLATNPGADTKSQMIKKGTDAIFKHLPIGYISKSEQKENSTIYEIINKILPASKE